jgi:hypothetical protein
VSSIAIFTSVVVVVVLPLPLLSSVNAARVVLILPPPLPLAPATLLIPTGKLIGLTSGSDSCYTSYLILFYR